MWRNSTRCPRALTQGWRVRRLSYVGGIKRLEDGLSIDYSRDFFGKPAYLTVSGQLNGEYYACALSSVYTFGPTFRAENSHTGRHLAEFWMIEPEMAFCDLSDDMQCAEDYVRFCCAHLLEHCASDVAFLDARFAPHLRAHLTTASVLRRSAVNMSAQLASGVATQLAPAAHVLVCSMHNPRA